MAPETRQEGVERLSRAGGLQEKADSDSGLSLSALWTAVLTAEDVRPQRQARVRFATAELNLEILADLVGGWRNEQGPAGAEIPRPEYRAGRIRTVERPGLQDGSQGTESDCIALLPVERNDGVA